VELASPTAAGRAQLSALSDAQLVALGCGGEVGALEILYRRHAAFAIHLAARIEGSSRDVEDIAHDAFVRAFERLDDLADRAAFRSWLGAIVVHAVRSRMRRHRLMNLLGLGKSSEPVDLDALASPDASPHVRAQIAQIYALLRTLPTDERIAWTLRCVEGHDLETVARMTRCSLATVKRRITRAQRFLDEHFVDHDGGDPPTQAGSQASASPPASGDHERNSELSSASDFPKEVPS
jgi:RNA polymerase sigma-70 factor (ECF subfamily)